MFLLNGPCYYCNYIVISPQLLMYKLYVIILCTRVLALLCNLSLSQVMVAQEIMRKSGYSVHPQEEQLR